MPKIILAAAGFVIILAVGNISKAQTEVSEVSHTTISTPISSLVSIDIYPQDQSGKTSINQGDVAFIEVSAPAGALEMVSGRAFGENVPFSEDKERARWFGLLGIDMEKAAGEYVLDISIKSATGISLDRKLSFTVLDKDFGVQRLTIPGLKEPDAATLARIKADQRAFGSAWSKPPAQRYFKEGFVRAVPGEVTGNFGVKRYINNVLKNPHSGIDYRAAQSEPVKAVAAGKIALVRDCYFSGNSILIDHGLGLYSMYFHLSEFKVSEGQVVETGQVIGLAGSTGRSTAPHLHLGFRLLGAKVDPEAVYNISKYISPQRFREAP